MYVLLSWNVVFACLICGAGVNGEEVRFVNAMDVLTLNLALQKLQVNKATKEGQLPLPASNYQCISEVFFLDIS